MKKLHIIAGELKWSKHIQLKKDKFNVTNGNSLLTLPANEVLPYSVLDQLEGKERYFLAEDWKRSKIWKANDVRLEDGKLIALGRRNKVLGEVSVLEKIDQDFPNFGPILEGLEEENNSLITVNIGSVKDVIDAMGVSLYKVGITQTTKNRYIIKSTESNGIGVIGKTKFRVDQIEKLNGLTKN